MPSARDRRFLRLVVKQRKKFVIHLRHNMSMNQQLHLKLVEPRSWELSELDKTRARAGIAAAREALRASQPFLWDNNAA